MEGAGGELPERNNPLPTPGIGNGEDWNAAQSGVGTSYPVDFEAQQTRGDEATPERDIVAVQDGETEIAIGFGNDGDGDRAISQDLAAAQRRPPEPHALQLRSERSVVVNPQVPLSEPEANTDKQGLLVLEPTTQSSELALKPPARSSELVGFSADAYSLMQFSNSIPILGALHHQNRKMDVMTENMGVMAKTMDVMAENMGKLLTKQADDDDKIGLRAKVEQLSKGLDSAENYLRSLLEERGDEKRANEDLQAQARQLSKENERLEQTVKAKVCNIEELEAQVIQLSNSLKDIQEDERQKQETLADKSAREEELHERVRQLEKEVRQLEKKLEVAKQYVPKNPEKYPLNPFTGYAIVVSNAVFNVQRGEYKKSMQDVANQLVADDAQKAVLDDAIRLAKALSDYGFEVKPMRNATDDNLLAALVECDKRWEQDKLVLIFIITHGNSAGFELANSKDFSQREVTDVLVQRNANGKPTILCMATCRHQVEGDLDLLDDAQSHVFLVNARRLGQRHFAEDKWFVDGLVKIFEQETERNFLTEIADMRLLQRPLDFDDRLGRILILPAFPARTWPPEEKEKTYNLVKSVFKYDPKPAQTTTAGTA